MRKKGIGVLVIEECLLTDIVYFMGRVILCVYLMLFLETGPEATIELQEPSTTRTPEIDKFGPEEKEGMTR